LPRFISSVWGKGVRFPLSYAYEPNGNFKVYGGKMFCGVKFYTSRLTYTVIATHSSCYPYKFQAMSYVSIIALLA